MSEAVDSTDDNEKCRLILEERRWGATPRCAFCNSVNVTRFKTDKRRFQCNEKQCRKQFTVIIGTIYENSQIPLSKWFLAENILRENISISSISLALLVGVSQRTGWLMKQRIKHLFDYGIDG